MGEYAQSAVTPLILIVEDREENLKQRMDIFKNIGCAPLGVTKADDAIRELRASPNIDLIMTDIHLGSADDDKSGIALAKLLKTFDGPPIVGYSAHFEPEQLTQEELSIFDRRYVKGDMNVNELVSSVEECREMALAYRTRRKGRAVNQLAFLREQFDISDPNITILRRLALAPDGQAAIESVLASAGFRLKVIETGPKTGLVRPIVVWLRDFEELVEAEVYGQPALYSVGESEEEAIEKLVDLMQLFSKQISSSAESDGPAKSLSEFLLHVFPVEGF